LKFDKGFRSLAALFVFSASLSAIQAQTVRSAAGADAASILGSVNQFRADLGALNPNNGQQFDSGRREINWDGVPDSRSQPNPFPGDTFRVRGALFTTPGTSLAMSADNSNPTNTPVEFGDVDPAYSSMFAAFSPQRLFAAIGSNIVDVNFVFAGTDTPAGVKGFGSVFTDVDLADTTSIEYFGMFGNSLGKFYVQNTPGDETFSFLGVSFQEAVITRVRITNGNDILAPGHITGDVVVMDDFIYGEPVKAVPEPASLAALGLGAIALIRKKRRA
jgi:hypothetical protein